MVGCRNVLFIHRDHFEVYQAFRWWGVGTLYSIKVRSLQVYQAFRWWGVGTVLRQGLQVLRVYQAFRWWGVGTQLAG